MHVWLLISFFSHILHNFSFRSQVCENSLWHVTVAEKIAQDSETPPRKTYPVVVACTLDESPSDDKQIVCYLIYIVNFDVIWYSIFTLSFTMLYSSFMVKAWMRFSDQLCPISCHPSCLSVNFSYFWLLLLKHMTNFIQTLHKASSAKGNSRWCT